MIYITFYDSPVGRLILKSDGEFLIGVEYFSGDYDADITDNLPIFTRTKKWFDCYFALEKPGIEEIDYKVIASPFVEKCCRQLSSIPYGSTITYKDIANKIGCSSYRAVGQAMNRNPLAIILPCHRVIGKNSKLIGYGGGISKKEFLLDLEKNSV